MSDNPAVRIALVLMATAMIRVFVTLLLGAAVAVAVELGLVMWSDPAEIWQAHRYLAPFLPAAILGTVFLGPIVALYHYRRLSACAPRSIWRRDTRVLPWLAVVVAVTGLGVGAAWFALTRDMQLPWDAALTVGTGGAGMLLALVVLVRRRLPPAAILLCGLIFGAWIAGGPAHRVAPQHALWPALACWLLATTVPVPRRGWPALALALGVATLGGLGLVRYDRDPAANAALAKRSFLSAPMASAVRAVADFDRDGTSGLLGGGDCDDLDPDTHPGATEIVGNGADDNCMGGDLAQAQVPPIAVDQASTAYEPPPRDPAGPDTRPDTRPNVLFITLDAVRADHLRPDLMPTVHRLAKRGLYAPVAYAPAPYTGYSFIDTMTSTATIDHHEQSLFYGYEPTLAQVLGYAGYRTVAVHCIVDLPADMVHGFEWVDNSLGPTCEDFRGVTADATADVALTYLAESDDERPLFLWVHFTDPHLPYIDSYEAEIARVDSAVAKILAAVEENTVTVVFSDHGESFGMHGFRGHVWRLDEEMLRVVLLLAGPGVPAGEIPWPASLIDIAPTVTELVGVAAPESWQGKSLLRDPGERVILFQSDYKAELDLIGARVGDHKITLNRRTGTYELYDVVADPDDQHNLVGDAALFQRMRRALGQAYDERFNDQRVDRKLRLLRERPVLIPKHDGPMIPGQAKEETDQP